MLDFILVSDLHIDENQFDISVFNNPDNASRVLLNLGDTFTHTMTPAKHIVGFMCKVAPYFKYAVFCLGNHDYYGRTINDTKEEVKELLEKRNPGNIIFLDGETIFDIPDTNISIYGDTTWTYMPAGIEQNIEDYMRILGKDGGYLTFKETNQINERILQKMKNFLSKDDGKVKIAATHFPPIHYDQGFQTTWLTNYFHNQLTVDKWYDQSWMKDVYWFHGHVHARYYRKYMGGYIVCNARGYSTRPEYFPQIITIDE